MAKNPYINQTRSELFDSAQNRAGKLQDGPHSDTGHLLLAMAMQLHNADMATRGPGGQLKGSGSLSDAYAQRLELLQRNARYEVLRDAADATLGSKATAWLQPGYYDGSPYQQGMVSDAGLLEVLAELELLRKR
ncbi:hypothetical protein ABE493_07665 [Stenotrophomonas terrae]|uniref:hypothetical protein n=1 Tax=Stenotrophomonas terrae TaxID=405446 RepID=UPI0032090DC2